MKKRVVQEAMVGYLFAAPIIISICIFTLYPILSAFIYSFTDFNPLEIKKFDIKFNPQEALEINTGFLPSELTEKESSIDFDLMNFIELDVGLKLDEEKSVLVQKYFDSVRLLKDFSDGKLDKEIAIKDFMGTYMTKYGDQFRKYKPKFLWFDNFVELVKDQYFWISLGNAFFFSLIVVPIQTLLAVILAVAANSKIKGVKFYKAVFFIPSITSSAAISMIFWMIYSKPGVINRLFGTSIDWLNEPNTALPAIMLMNIWTTAGYFMVTFLAGLQDIPDSIYEAAEIDGASGLTTFWKITMPLLRPQILFVAITGTIGCMQVFDQIYFLIKNIRNITISFFIYKNAFEYGKMGYASAVALVLFLIILAITAVQRKYIKDEY